MKCLVCDFGGSSVKYAVVDDNAQITHDGKAPAPVGSLDEFVDTIYKLYQEVKDEVEGIALSLPGVIDVEGGIHCGSGAYGSILTGINVRDVVSQKCGVKVALENDGKAGALAEAWKGKLIDVKDGVVLILGSGIGGGIIKDGRIHRGKNFSAGELSFMITDSECNFGSGAWLNVGAFGLTHRLCREKNLDFDVQDNPETIKSLDTILGAKYPKFDEAPARIKADGKQFFKWIDEGDPVALKIYDSFLKSLSILIANVQLVFAPDRVVIGGGLSLAERLLPDLQAYLNKVCDSTGISQNMRAEVVKSDYRDEVNLLGAMYNYIQQYCMN